MSMLNNIKTSEIVNDLSLKTIGIYGRPGIGKSTLASMFDGAVFAATEAGLNSLEVKKINITSYDAPLTEADGVISGGFLSLCAEIMAGNHEYQTLVIDTFDNLARLCTEWKCRELDIDDISDFKKFGAYHLVTQELHRVIDKLSKSPYGLVMVSHVKQTEKESKTKKWAKDTISASGKNANVMVDICDLLLYMDSKMVGDEEVGIIRTKPSIFWDAKDKANRLPAEIEYPLDKPEVAFKIIKDAYSSTEGGSEG